MIVSGKNDNPGIHPSSQSAMIVGDHHMAVGWIIRVTRQGLTTIGNSFRSFLGVFSFNNSTARLWFSSACEAVAKKLTTAGSSSYFV